MLANFFFRLVWLTVTTVNCTAAGGLEIDSGKSCQFIDTDPRLGNTGAATLFVQMAIGVMGSYRDGGVGAAMCSLITVPPRHRSGRLSVTPRQGTGTGIASLELSAFHAVYSS